MVTKKTAPRRGDRVAIIDGVRTPFVKSGTSYRDLTNLDLGRAVVGELIQRANLNQAEIDQLVFGQVVGMVEAPNIAREIVLGSGMPKSIDAFSVVRACATSTQAMICGVHAILCKDAQVVICGGADSTSRPPITLSDRAVKALVKANNAKTAMGKAKALLKLRPKDLLPKPPALRELSTGLTMGESGEKMAKENQISREAQDRFAMRSHQKAARGWENGVFAPEVMPLAIPPKYEETVEKDGFVRPDTTLERLAQLKPVFDRKHGSITAGTSSPLTDGAAALLIMEEEKAKALGYEPLAYIKAWAFAGLDASWQLLMGPSFATPIALDKAGMKLADIDLIDIHEAFSAQVLSNLQAWRSKQWAKTHLGRDEMIGEVDDDDARLNIYGGSIAIGHPFAATGARQILTMARELDRRGGGTALITQCAAGALGGAVILER